VPKIDPILGEKFVQFFSKKCLTKSAAVWYNGSSAKMRAFSPRGKQNRGHT